MKAFAGLLDLLLFTPSPHGKIQHLIHYFNETENPDRGYALAALTGALDLKAIKPAQIRKLIEKRLDAVLFRYSNDFVGDIVETTALTWDSHKQVSSKIYQLHEVIERLQNTKQGQITDCVEMLLDELPAQERYTFLKLATGGVRVGVSTHLARKALAKFGQVDISAIEELWHGLEPPYANLFSWLEGRAEKPRNLAKAPFHSFMLAHALEEKEPKEITPQIYAAEWKWDGVRVQLVSEKGVAKLYSRAGDDISNAFPDILENVDFEGRLDGQLLIANSLTGKNNGLFSISDFATLQKRLNSKTVSKKILEKSPAIIRLYDYLKIGDKDLRPLPFKVRRQKLEHFFQIERTRFDLSPLISFQNFGDLKSMRQNPPDKMIKGLMLKQWQSPYLKGRPKEHWYQWKREPFRMDAVLLYVQMSHGRGAGLYTDFTFALWTDDNALVPVGKASCMLNDEELLIIDKFVSENTVERFGPVRSVRAEAEFGLVLEVAFEGVDRSMRHKSGIVLRLPHIARLRMDKAPKEADTLAKLKKLL